MTANHEPAMCKPEDRMAKLTQKQQRKLSCVNGFMGPRLNETQILGWYKDSIPNDLGTRRALSSRLRSEIAVNMTSSLTQGTTVAWYCLQFWISPTKDTMWAQEPGWNHQARSGLTRPGDESFTHTLHYLSSELKCCFTTPHMGTLLG